MLGISTDSIASHGKFAEKLNLPYPLLSDPDAGVSTAYEVYKEKNMYGKKYMGIDRTTFVIGADGLLTHIHRKVRVEGHAARVLEDLHAAATT